MKSAPQKREITNDDDNNKKKQTVRRRQLLFVLSPMLSSKVCSAIWTVNGHSTVEGRIVIIIILLLFSSLATL